MKIQWKTISLLCAISVGISTLLACSTPPTRASNADLDSYQPPPTSRDAAPQTTSRASDTAFSVRAVESVEELADWYRPLFESSDSFVMQWDIETHDEELDDVNHRERYTTNCVIEPVGPVEGMIARSLSCDNGEDDFFQGYYVAAREGVWLLERLPRSIDQFRRLMDEGEIYEIPLLPATPREGARSIRDGEQSLIFSMRAREDGGWCRSFSIPSQPRSYEYLYCIDRHGAIARAAYSTANDSRVLREVNYRQWTGRLQ